MQSIIYDVAVSADGFICGADGDVSAFPHDGPIVDDYRVRLAEYGTVLMGRATYEFGHAYGLEPGQNPYPHMHAIVISSSLSLPGDAVTVLSDLSTIANVAASASKPIYLCGGGHLAGAMLEAGLIDEIVLKRAPVLLGAGVPLFGENTASVRAVASETKDYGGGLLLQRYRLR